MRYLGWPLKLNLAIMSKIALPFILKDNLMPIGGVEIMKLFGSSKIGRNDPCWCGSGLKYKKCHINRDREKPLNPGEIVNKIKKTFHGRKRDCLHPLASKEQCGSVINSHLISKKQSISTIAENGHVFSYDENTFNFPPLNSEMRQAA